MSQKRMLIQPFLFIKICYNRKGKWSFLSFFKPPIPGINDTKTGDDMYFSKKRLYEILQLSDRSDRLGHAVDLFFILLISLNVLIVFLYTFTLPPALLPIFRDIELVSIVIFTAEYFLRIWTADLLYPNLSPGKARLHYLTSTMALIDLLSILPFYLPILLPYDLKVLRTVRLIRLFQIFKLSRYTSPLASIVRVIRRKSAQLTASMIVVFLLIIVSSLLMYSAENPVQPETFSNAFSGMWWAISTLTTVGYGDIYPVTALGKVIGSVIAFLGVGLLAVPTAIISTGFMEQNEQHRHDHEESGMTYCPHCGKRLR